MQFIIESTNESVNDTLTVIFFKRPVDLLPGGFPASQNLIYNFGQRLASAAHSF